MKRWGTNRRPPRRSQQEATRCRPAYPSGKSCRLPTTQAPLGLQRREKGHSHQIEEVLRRMDTLKTEERQLWEEYLEGKRGEEIGEGRQP